MRNPYPVGSWKWYGKLSNKQKRLATQTVLRLMKESIEASFKSPDQTLGDQYDHVYANALKARNH